MDPQMTLGATIMLVNYLTAKKEGKAMLTKLADGWVSINTKRPMSQEDPTEVWGNLTTIDSKGITEMISMKKAEIKDLDRLLEDIERLYDED